MLRDAPTKFNIQQLYALSTLYLCVLYQEKKELEIRQQIGLEETIVKEIEQKGHVQRMAEGRLPKIALKWMPKQKRARGRRKKTVWKV